MSDKERIAAQWFAKAENLYNDGDRISAVQALNTAMSFNDAEVRGWILAARIAADSKSTDIVLQALERAIGLEEFHKLPNNIKIIVLDQLSSIYGNINRITDFIAARKLIVELTDDITAKAAAYSSYLYALQSAQLVSDNDILVAHADYNKLFQYIKPLAGERRVDYSKKRIRVGYISADFCQHPVTFFFLKLLYFHNKERFEIFCYSSVSKPDKATQQIKVLCEHWRDVSLLSYGEAARIIYDDEIDILFDLGGHNVKSLLPVLAYKPAPIQISGIGYIGTTGLKAVDYFLTDRYCDLWPDNEGDFTEKLLVLSNSHFCYSMRDDAKQAQPAPFIKKGFITFGVFNRIEKITDNMLATWSIILKQVPQSHILFKSGFVNNEFYCQAMKQRIQAAGIDLERVIFEKASVDYLERYLDVDIALDTYPCCGGTTSCDALIMGVPLITMVGKRHVARFGYSILKNVGLDDWVALDEMDYVEKAVQLAADHEKLKWLHLNLRQMMLQSPLMDGQLYAAEIESLYEEIISQKE